MKDGHIELNGMEYAPVGPKGNRAIIVVDRGWIFAGDVTESEGRIRLARCVWVFKWVNCGFSAVIDNPTMADIRKLSDVDVPAQSEIYRIPVNDEWGL